MLDRITQGEIPRKHHIALRDAAGNLRYEECFTRDGFDGAYTILYHQGRPHTQRVATAEHGFPIPTAASPQRLSKRHFLGGNLAVTAPAPIDSRTPLLFNDDVVLSLVKPSAPDPVYFANGDGDDVYFIFKGGGICRSILGDLRFNTDDYLIVPRGLLHRLIPDAGEQIWLSIECRGGVGLLKQWRNEVGQLRMDAPYSHRDFRRPELQPPTDEGIRSLVVKRGDAFHGFRYDHRPLDVVGWDGSV